MGKYHLFGYYNRKPAYQHQSGLDYLFYAEGEAWVIGAMFGGARVGIVNFDKHPCPYQLKSLWRHSGTLSYLKYIDWISYHTNNIHEALSIHYTLRLIAYIFIIVGGKLEKDAGITMSCLDDELQSSLIIQPVPQPRATWGWTRASTERKDGW